MKTRWQWGLPLFMKELLEQAARRRTYLLRIGFVAFLSYFAVSSMQQHLAGRNSLDALGQGLPILKALTNLEFWGIYLFLPAMACGVLTNEKERNTLSLLFLTRLGPWTIIFEKLLSRLFPMLMFLCCALPIMAFTYAMGGLTLGQLFASTYLVLVSLILTACIAVMCSAYAHSTTAAFVLTYVVLFGIQVVSAAIWVMVPPSAVHSLTDTIASVAEWLTFTRRSPLMARGFYAYGLPPTVMMQLGSPGQFYAQLSSAPSGAFDPPVALIIILMLPSLAMSATCLLLTRLFLYRRAYVTSSNPLLKTFRVVDRLFFWLHSRVKFDVKLVKESDTLPDSDPIAWREVSKRSLGQFRYLVRIMVPLMFPVIFTGIFMASASTNDLQGGNSRIGITPLIFCLAMAALSLILVTAASTIPLERSRQTWDVLRSVPLYGQEILLQKLRGVRRLQWVCLIPVICAILLQGWWRYQLLTAGLSANHPRETMVDGNFLWWEYLLGSIGGIIVYSEIVKWIGLWCGLMSRNAMRAIFTGVFMIAVICIVPAIITFLVTRYTFPDLEFNASSTLPWQIGITASLSPVSFVAVNELGDLRWLMRWPLAPIACHLLCQIALLGVIRWHILSRADRYLGRSETRPSAQQGHKHPGEIPTSPMLNGWNQPQIMGNSH